MSLQRLQRLFHPFDPIFVHVEGERNVVTKLSLRISERGVHHFPRKYRRANNLAIYHLFEMTADGVRIESLDVYASHPMYRGELT